MTLGQREAVVLGQATGVASRSGCKLSLRLTSGAPLSFDDYDDRDCANPPRKRWLKAHKVEWYHHYLDAYLPKCQLFVLMIRYDENDDYILIDARNGRSTRILGSVDPSPNCTHALEVTPESEVDVDGPNVIRIWRRVGSKFVRSWERRLEWNFNPGFARWDGEDQVILSCSLSVAGDERFAIRRRAGRWQIDPAQKAYCVTQLLR